MFGAEEERAMAMWDAAPRMEIRKGASGYPCKFVEEECGEDLCCGTAK